MTFIRPYHLTSLEVPLTCARAVLYGKADMIPLEKPVVEVCALAKKDLKPGDMLDQIGEYCYRAWAMEVVARPEGRGITCWHADRRQGHRTDQERRTDHRRKCDAARIPAGGTAPPPGHDALRQGSAQCLIPPSNNIPYAVGRYSPEALKEALRKMYLIRKFEEGAEESYMRGLIHGTMHLCIGQEASAVGSCMSLTDEDKITSTHRGHGHCVAKGADLGKMFAEFFGKETGYCKGRGGSMHIADLAKGNLGANGIVGGGLPIAVGAALSAKRLGTGAVTVCFFGDGANNEGAFHEALNMAAVWKLPVVFVCENNKYGMSTSTERSTAVKNIAERAASYAMPWRHGGRQRFLGCDRSGGCRRGCARATVAAPASSKTSPIAGAGIQNPTATAIAPRKKSPNGRAAIRSQLWERCWWSTRSHADAEIVEIETQAGQIINDAIEFATNGPDPRIEDTTRDVYTTLSVA